MERADQHSPDDPLTTESWEASTFHVGQSQPKPNPKGWKGAAAPKASQVAAQKDRGNNEPVAAVLSPDTLRLIFQLVEPSDLLSLACVSRQFNKIAAADFFWKPIYEKICARTSQWIAEIPSNFESLSYKERFRIRVGPGIYTLHLLKSNGLSSLKTVVVGDGAVGKTTLLIRFVEGRFPVEYIPTVFDNSSVIVGAGSHSVNLELWDTAGPEEYSRLRALSYPETDVFLVCFSVISAASFSNVKTKWMPELWHHAAASPNYKTILVGTKSDLRTDPEVLEKLAAGGMTPITEDLAIALAKELDMDGYVETSSLSGDGVMTCFRTAIDLIVGKEKGTFPSGRGGRNRGQKQTQCILM